MFLQKTGEQFFVYWNSLQYVIYCVNSFFFICLHSWVYWI